MSHSNRLKRCALGFITGLAAGYLLLLIPSESPDPPAADSAAAFVWNQDEYWQQLEAAYQEARVSSLGWDVTLEIGFTSLQHLIDSCRTIELKQDSELLKALEELSFRLAPYVAAAPESLGRFLDIQQQLRQVIKQQSRRWDMNSAEARDRLYRLLYGSRTAVEEIMLQLEPGAVPALVLATEEPSSTPAAELQGLTIHSGDILVSRGGAPTSALIARGNDYPGNFSHVALAHVDETTGEISIVEAHIERGVAVASAGEYLRDKKLRIMVLRLRADLPAMVADPMLPHNAATVALERALREHTAYDFEMDFADNEKLFCSEVASAPYADLGVTLWMGVSRITSPGVRSWLAAFGVTHFETQEPSDLEYDPQLTVVAEWREPQTLYKDHLDNAVIDIMLERAETGEKLTYELYKLPFARILKAYSFVKNLLGSVGPIPEGMSAGSALKNDSFSSRHTLIKSRLIELAQQFEQERGYRPPYWELVRLARQVGTEIAD